MKKLVRIRYIVGEDCFALEISTDGGETWGLVMSAKCCAIDGKGETNYVHYQIIAKLNHAVDMGYKFVV